MPPSLRVSALLVLVAGCASTQSPTTQPTTLRQRQDAMIADPGNYPLPSIDSNISGGGMMDFDKDGFKRDIDHVLNP